MPKMEVPSQSTSAAELQRLAFWPPLTDPKPKDWEPPATRRKPRMSVTVQTGEIRPDPFPLDFCMWLQSTEFGNNRQHILLLTGSRWLGEHSVPNGTLIQGVMRWLKTGSRAQSSILAP